MVGKSFPPQQTHTNKGSFPFVEEGREAQLYNDSLQLQTNPNRRRNLNLFLFQDVDAHFNSGIRIPLAIPSTKNQDLGLDLLPYSQTSSIHFLGMGLYYGNLLMHDRVSKCPLQHEVYSFEDSTLSRTPNIRATPYKNISKLLHCSIF